MTMPADVQRLVTAIAAWLLSPLNTAADREIPAAILAQIAALRSTSIQADDRYLHALMGALDQGVGLFDEQRRLQFYNGAFASLFGLHGARPVSRPVSATRQMGERLVSLPDGSMLLAVEHPVAGGGWVGAYRPAGGGPGTGLPQLPPPGGVVLAVAVNGVRALNQTLGRTAGDALLLAISNRLGAALQPGDVWVQESAIAHRLTRPGTTGTEGTIWAEHILRLVTAPVSIAGQLLAAGGSAGVCAIDPSAGPDVVAASISQAGAALQRAQESGRGCDMPFTVRLYEPGIDGAARARLALGTRLRLAVNAKRLTLHYQPQIDLRTRRITGFEALLRWTDPDEGVVSPADFVPLAEELGLVGEIGSWALGTACAAARDWPDEVGIAVNVSALQLNDGTLGGTVRQALAESGLSPARLELELTETCVVHNTAAAAAALQELRTLGIRVAIDDFGTGVSSLGGLPDLPIDKIKIDQSFTAKLGHGRAQVAIVRSIIGLCGDLGVQCTAEGVETQDQLAILAGIDCGGAQGFFLGRPTRAQGVADALARYGQ